MWPRQEFEEHVCIKRSLNFNSLKPTPVSPVKANSPGNCSVSGPYHGGNVRCADYLERTLIELRGVSSCVCHLTVRVPSMLV